MLYLCRLENILLYVHAYSQYSNNFPTDADKKVKRDSNNYKSHGLIGMSIFNYLWFLHQRIDAPDVSWEKLRTIFGKHNEI